MAGTTTNGFPYPESTDFVTDGAQAIEDLAVDVDAKMGLYKMVPTSATNGTVAANGDVTANATVSSLTITGCFTSDFDNYLIQLAGGSNSASNSDLFLQLRTSAGVTSTTGYYGAVVYSTLASSTPLAFNTSNATQFQNAGSTLTTTSPFMNCNLLSPNLARKTFCTSQFIRPDACGTFNAWHDVATAYNSIVISPSGGTISGCVVKIFGYN